MQKNNVISLSGLITLISFIFSANCYGQAAISYKDFIAAVKEQHPLAKKAQNLVAVGKYQQRSANGLFDPYLSGSLDNKYFLGTNYYNTAVAEVKQPLYSGQSLKAGFEYGNGSFVNPEETTKGNVLPYLGLEFSVLQGLVIDKRRYEVQKSGHYKNLLETESIINYNELLFHATESYVEWLKDYTLVEINKRFVETAAQRFKALIALSQIGERPAIDTVESGILIQTREIDYGNSLIFFNKALYELNSYRWQGDTNRININILPGEKLIEFEETCLSNFLKIPKPNSEENPGLKYYNFKSNLLKLEKKYKAELIKPKLDLRYNLLGNVESQSGVIYNNNYKWGVGFSMPLFLRNPTNDYKISKLNLQNNQYELNNKTAELNTKIEALVNVLGILAEQIQTAKRTLLYSRLLMEAEKVKFDNNESSLFLLNTRESKVLESEIKLVELQAKFIQNYFYTIYLSGTMQYGLN